MSKIKDSVLCGRCGMRGATDPGFHLERYGHHFMDVEAEAQMSKTTALDEEAAMSSPTRKSPLRFVLTYSSADGSRRVRSFLTLKGAVSTAKRLPGWTEARVYDSRQAVGSRLVWGR